MGIVDSFRDLQVQPERNGSHLFTFLHLLLLACATVNQSHTKVTTGD
jgi:hypothetical protein